MQIIFLILGILLLDSFNNSFSYFGPGVATPILLLIISFFLILIFLILVLFYYPIKKFLLKIKKK